MLAQMSEREKHILEMLSEEADISIQQLSDELGVSQVTIRSDLSSLESKGVILRLRGGALPAFHPDILEHQKNNPAIKKRIAQAAAELVSDGDTIMVNDGTTTSMIPRYLLGKRDIRLVTNSTLVLPYARVNPSLHTMLIGGEFKASTEAIVGSQALAQLETFHVPLRIYRNRRLLGGKRPDHPSPGRGRKSPKKMAGLGDKIVLTADSSKYGRKGFVNFLPLEKVDIVITDKGISAAARQAMAEIGLELILV
jgi:DeoR/GlpR family transcriptional regulator of sugar metabolism